MKPNCWDCKYFERVRMSAFCHGGKRITKLRQKDWYSGSIQFCTYFKPKDRVIREEVEKRKVTQPDPGEWNNHTVACLLAELFGDTCACNYNGIDEWLPEKCEVIDTCPNPVGVACWEQFLKHRAERRTE